MAEMERTYNIPLRKEWLKTARHNRTKKAVKACREFLLKHMKGTEVRIGKHLNKELWKHGIKNPPHHVKVTAAKDDDGVVRAELYGNKYEEMTKEEAEKGQKEKKKQEDKKAGNKPQETKKDSPQKAGKEGQEDRKDLDKDIKEGEQKIKEELGRLDKETKDIKTEKTTKE